MELPSFTFRRVCLLACTVLTVGTALSSPGTYYLPTCLLYEPTYDPILVCHVSLGLDRRMEGILLTYGVHDLLRFPLFGGMGNIGGTLCAMY